MAFGEENPTEGETPSSWALWSDGAGGNPTIIGDADWGKLEIDINEQGRSRVYDLGSASDRTHSLTRNRYGTGQGTSTLQIRGSDTLFAQDDELPEWVNYSAPTSQNWRYVQVREIKTG
jgi:hypothetical protein